jgi:anthranilate synthase component 1
MVRTGTKMPVEWPCERQPEHSRAARDSAVKRIGYKENEVYFHVPEERELFCSNMRWHRGPYVIVLYTAQFLCMYRGLFLFFLGGVAQNVRVLSAFRGGIFMKIESSEILIEEIEGDTLTPISVYQKISGSKKFLLESSHKHNENGRFSFIGSDPIFELFNINGETILKSESTVERRDQTFSEVLKELLPAMNLNIDIPFIGGGVGYVGYDYIRSFEEIGPVLADSVDMPDAHLMFFNVIIVFDHQKQKINLVGILYHGQSMEELILKINKRKEELSVGSKTAGTALFSLSDFKSSQTQNDYVESVRKARDLIQAGEIFQVVLSRRLTAKAEGDPFYFYRKLRINNPSPYMYYLDFEEYVIAGSSPESLVKYRNGTIYTNPIAGTRPRGKSAEEDVQLENELRNDEKELAEHKMLVDLSRNDMGRICEIGSVKVTKFMEVERYQFVMHLVSEVSGNLLPGAHPFEGLTACLPAGTVSGAPKIRAMQIINSLEKEKRGVYSGAIGYFSACGNMDFALAIRTMIVKDGKGYFQAGAGIVFDSQPEKEYEETIHKLKAMMEAANDSANR